MLKIILSKLFPPSLIFIWLGIIFGSVILTIARLALAFLYYRESSEIPLNTLAEAFWLGWRFDMRVMVLVFLPLIFLAIFPLFNPWAKFWQKQTTNIKNNFWQKNIINLWSMWLTISFLLLSIVYIIDAGNISWLKQRVGIYTFSLAENTREAFDVIWNSYPVIPILVILILLLVLIFLSIRLLINRCVASDNRKNPNNIILHNDFSHSNFPAFKKLSFFSQIFFSFINLMLKPFSHLLLIALVIHSYPSRGYSLRWSDTATLQNPWAIILAQNPVQSLFDSYKHQEKIVTINDLLHYRKTLLTLYPNAQALRSDEALIKADKEKSAILLQEISTPKNNLAPNGKAWNVVVVLMESYAFYKTDMSGNPLKPTPYLGELAKNSLLFTNVYTTYENTARAIFSVLTALPDVGVRDVSTRNPSAGKQQLLINEFDGYQKYFFMGGDPAFANVRALFANINNLKLYDMFTNNAQVLNSWGVPDHLLMENAHQQFIIEDKSKNPFVAVILMASHHEPYFVPDELRPKININNDLINLNSKDWLKYGMSSYEEYASMLYSDYAIANFMQLAQNSEYFENTIFAFIGDHGINGYPGDHAPNKIKDNNLRLRNRHVPWLIYAPSLIKPQINTSIVSQIDIFPTVMGLAGINYQHTTMGRNVLAVDYQQSAFTFTPEATPEVGFMDDNYYFLGRSDGNNNRLYKLEDNAESADNKVIDVSKTEVAKINFYKEKALAQYTLARYLVSHNFPLN